jgi:PEP-CTERM motif
MTASHRCISRLMAYAIVAVTLSQPGVAATLYNFAYHAQNGDVLSGQLTGTLQPDMNTVAIESVPNTAFNGDGVGGLGWLYSFTGGSDPVASLDGTVISWIACDSSDCGSRGDRSAVLGFGLGRLNASLVYGSHFEGYESWRWSLSVAPSDSVPEPNAMGLVGLGGAALAAWRRRQRGSL